MPAVCCGPGISDFSKIASLDEMLDHIYGRKQLPMTPGREHMFVRELHIYIDSFREEFKRFALDISNRTPEYFEQYLANLSDAVEYYRQLAAEFNEEELRQQITEELASLRAEVAKAAPGKIPSIGNPVEHSLEG